jgi:murein L,D-transpeptidase YafK
MSSEEKKNRRNFYNKQTIVDALLADHNTRRGAYQIKMQAFKSEQILEVYLSTPDSTWTLIREYPFCNFSGTLGPKIREGDRQIPEGIYKIKVFNPKSKFYLSMGLDYPNERDMKIADTKQPGSDIYIHGGCRTVGCIPITDEKIAELYLLAQSAKPNIEVVILPFKPSEKNKLYYFAEYPEHQEFWKSLFTEVKIMTI